MSIWSKPLNEKYIPITPIQLIAAVVVLFVVDGMNIIDVPFIDADFSGAQSTIEDLITDAVVPDGEEDGVQVQVKIWAEEGLDVDQAGGASTALSIIVRVYKLDGGEYTLLEQKTTSSGTATLGKMYWSGSSVYLQARQADVSSADPYVSPIVEKQIPQSSSAEFSDVCLLDPIYVRDVTGTAPTLAVRDQSAAAISDNSVNYLNTTDTVFSINLHTIDSDTFYGCVDFTDAKTDYSYDGGVFFVWKGTAAQPFQGYKYTWSDPTNVFYVWEISDYMFDDSSAGVATDVLSVILQTDGSNLNADATVVLDVHDIVWIRSTQMTSSDLIDGGAVGVTAITTKVA